jgi:16S rRNA (cytosine967-C5)-methyltransferase
MADLVLLDVPCSNTGVLARRPEARYRYSKEAIASVVRLQREIITVGAKLLKPGGHLLYSTCSLDERENQAQSRWIADEFDATLVKGSLTLPAGRDTSYHDGSYSALLRL